MWGFSVVEWCYVFFFFFTFYFLYCVCIRMIKNVCSNFSMVYCPLPKKNTFFSPFAFGVWCIEVNVICCQCKLCLCCSFMWHAIKILIFFWHESGCVRLYRLKLSVGILDWLFFRLCSVIYVRKSVVFSVCVLLWIVLCDGFSDHFCWPGTQSSSANPLLTELVMLLTI